MSENKIAQNEIQIDGLTEKEARELKALLSKFMKSYSQKDKAISDKEWLAGQYKAELPELSLEQAEKLASETIDSVAEYDNNLASLNAACAKGQSKEQWFAEKVADAATGVSVIEYGKRLQFLNDAIHEQNEILTNAMLRKDGEISQASQFHGNIAENMIGRTAQIDGILQGKNIRVEVRDVNTANSVDVVAKNLDTGHYQNYQLKFCKTAKATINAVADGNYNNQRIVIPSDQLKEIQNSPELQRFLKEKGLSNKTFTDKIEMDGAQGKSFTYDEMVEMKDNLQKDGVMPDVNYNHFNTKSLLLNLGKEAAYTGLQAAALSVGIDMAVKACSGEKLEADEAIELALTTGADAGIKAAATGALNVGVQRGVIGIIPKSTPIGVLANIACVGIENIKIFGKMATGEMTTSQGLDRMGRTTTSMWCGLTCGGAGGLLGNYIAAPAVLGLGAAALVASGPVGILLGIGAIGTYAISGLVGGMVGYMAGSSFGDKVYSGFKKACSAVKNTAKAAWNVVKSGFSKIKSSILG